jgi:hypothetical protein
MSIATLEQYRKALHQRLDLIKSGGHTSVISSWNTLWDGTGNPPAGTLAVGNTANGVVPTDTTTGAPTIAFSSSKTGYLSWIDGNATPASRIVLYDRLFHCGAYAFNANTTLTSQPSYSSRVPGGTDFTGLQIWVEAVTSFTGAPTITVTYTNQDGTAAQSTGGISLASAFALGRMQQLPLAAGDVGVKKIESVVATVASAGTFNIIVARPLATMRFDITQQGAVQPIEVVGMPQVWPDSCLALLYQPDTAGNAGTQAIAFSTEIASG